MKVLVTGGTGFVGAWTAKAAQDAGHQVRFLVRTPARLGTSAEQIGVDISDYVVGDIADVEATAAALEGCDAVIHCAAMVSTDPSRADEMLHTNLEGARNVLGGAARAKLDPIIHVSSFTALFRPGLEALHADLPVVGGSDGVRQVQSRGRGVRARSAGRRRTGEHHLSGRWCWARPPVISSARPPRGSKPPRKMHGVPWA